MLERYILRGLNKNKQNYESKKRMEESGEEKNASRFRQIININRRKTNKQTTRRNKTHIQTGQNTHTDETKQLRK